MFDILHCNFLIGPDLGKVRALSLNTHRTYMIVKYSTVLSPIRKSEYFFGDIRLRADSAADLEAHFLFK